MSDPKAVPNSQDTAKDQDELLETGQEEVFSRTEVELGRIEHASDAGKSPSHPKPNA
jgi:hypothetical protein